MSGTPILFQPYTELRQPLPPLAWRVVRWMAGLVTAAVIALCFWRPATGRLAFWGILVPALPLLFVVAPGLWRNVCPMASLNQVPRTLGFSRGLTVPVAIQPYAPLISGGLFLAVVPLRHPLLDRNGLALGIFLLTVLALAFIGGVAFKGKSGWCSQICPMNAVERLYGQSPLAVVPNSHCRPCVGCTRNCYDFNPTAAYLADIHDTSHRLGSNRMLFAGALPWVVAAFYLAPHGSQSGGGGLALSYSSILLAAVTGIGLFHLMESALPVSAHKLVLLHAAAALILFYLLGSPVLAGVWGAPPRATLPIVITVTALVVAVAAIWLRRAWPRERAYHSAVEAPPPRVAEHVLSAHAEQSAGRAEVRFDGRPAVLAAPGVTLLDLAEANHVPISSGCRMGMCGADPLRVLAGEGSLSPATASERSTLARLGLDAGCRLACSARVSGPVAVTTELDAGSAGGSHAPPGAFAADPGVGVVVVVGAGAAGVAAATEARRLAPDADVILIGGESYDHYNRMAVSRLVSESTSIEGLYLMPRDWHSARRISYRRGVDATALDPGTRTLTTDDGETIRYDRLILACGATAALPPISGAGLSGVHVLRSIDDGVAIQQHLRRHRGRQAVIVGGGLLGLEVADSLIRVGVRVTVLDRGPWPLGRQLDRDAGEILLQLMAELGITILPNSSAAEMLGDQRLSGVLTDGGRILPADLCLIAAGIQPELGLAVSAGLEAGRGVKVDSELRTSDPAIYACGDIAEVDGSVLGLWTAAVEQGRIAATNALGGDLTFKPVIPPTKLKVAAIDLLSVGRTAAEPGWTEVVVADLAARRYRKLVIREGRLVGGIVLGYPELFEAVTAGVDAGRDVSGIEDRLREGDWAGISDDS